MLADACGAAARSTSVTTSLRSRTCGRIDLAAGEGEQLAGEVGGAPGCLLDLPDVIAGRLAVPSAVGRARGASSSATKRRVVEDHREQVVEVVRDPAGELAEALQPLGLLQLGLGVRLASLSWPAIPVLQRLEPVPCVLQLAEPAGHGSGTDDRTRHVHDGQRGQRHIDQRRVLGDAIRPELPDILTADDPT